MNEKEKLKLETLLEQLENLPEEEKEIVRKKINKKINKKLELEPKTFQTISQIIQFTNQFLEQNKPVGLEKLEKELEPNLQISFGLYNQKKTDLTGETIKTLQIWWKNKEKLKEFKARIK